MPAHTRLSSSRQQKPGSSALIYTRALIGFRDCYVIGHLLLLLEHQKNLWGSSRRHQMIDKDFLRRSQQKTGGCGDDNRLFHALHSLNPSTGLQKLSQKQGACSDLQPAVLNTSFHLLVHFIYSSFLFVNSKSFPA